MTRALPPEDEYTSPIRWISDIVRLVGSFLPSAAAVWIKGYARSPGEFVVLLGVVGGLIFLGSRIASRIAGKMGAIWRGGAGAPAGLPNDWVFKLRTNPLYIGGREGLKHYIAPAFFAALFVYLGLALASHLLYNVQDVAGYVCRDNGEAQSFGKNVPASRDFDTADICNKTGILVEGDGAKYKIVVEATSPWSDGAIPASPLGFHTNDAPSWVQRAILFLALPFRRELIRPWYRLVLRVGATGGEESFIDSEPEKNGKIEVVIKPNRKGELFIFVNDAVIGIPGLYDVFYGNNIGTGKITVTRK